MILKSLVYRPVHLYCCVHCRRITCILNILKHRDNHFKNSLKNTYFFVLINLLNANNFLMAKFHWNQTWVESYFFLFFFWESIFDMALNLKTQFRLNIFNFSIQSHWKDFSFREFRKLSLITTRSSKFFYYRGTPVSKLGCIDRSILQ